MQISSATQTGPADASVPSSSASSQSQRAPAARPTTDTVQISTAAQSALQEASETAAQTAKEAQHGDRQAQRLLAKEAAEKIAAE